MYGCVTLEMFECPLYFFGLGWECVRCLFVCRESFLLGLVPSECRLPALASAVFQQGELKGRRNKSVWKVFRIVHDVLIVTNRARETS